MHTLIRFVFCANDIYEVAAIDFINIMRLLWHCGEIRRKHKRNKKRIKYKNKQINIMQIKLKCLHFKVIP